MSDLTAGDDHLECHYMGYTGQPGDQAQQHKHGFVKHRSCWTILISSCDKVACLVDEGKALVQGDLDKLD